MSDTPFASPRTLRAALARATYAGNRVRLTGESLAGFDCLFSSRQGLFAVGECGRLAKIAHGHYFGIRWHGEHLYAFEACDWPFEPTGMGRIVRMRRDGGRLVEPVVLTRGLDNQCHQIAIFDDALWVVDTRNQALLQFTLAGEAVAVHTPLPVAPPEDTTGTYRHINSVAKIGDRIALMLHNSTAPEPRPSELAWLNRDCVLVERTVVEGEGCHDIVPDANGVLWHCGSMAGEIVNSAGLHHKLSATMTRGLAMTAARIVVGSSDFATRDQRGDITGDVHFLNRDLTLRVRVTVPAAPTDLILL